MYQERILQIKDFNYLAKLNNKCYLDQIKAKDRKEYDKYFDKKEKEINNVLTNAYKSLIDKDVPNQLDEIEDLLRKLVDNQHRQFKGSVINDDTRGYLNDLDDVLDVINHHHLLKKIKTAIHI